MKMKRNVWMKKEKSIVMRVTLLLALVPLLVIPTGATIVSIDDTFMEEGGNAITQIMINNVSYLGVADITLSFDPSVVHIFSVDSSDFDFFWPVINNSAGTVRMGGIDFGDGLYGDVKFAEVTLNAVGEHGEITALNMSINELKEAGPVEITIPATVDNATAFINLPPVAIPLSVHYHNNVGSEYLSKAYFKASASYDPDGDSIIAYNWYFGDGNSSTISTTEHVYWSYKWDGSDYEPFNVGLTVTDAKGLENTAHMQVNVYMAGDANGDGEVDIVDATIVELEYWMMCSGDNWGTDDRKDKADLNNDCAVDIEDAAIVEATYWRTA